MDRFPTPDMKDGVDNFNLMVTCIKDLVDKNYKNRLELVQRFVDYAIKASENFQNVLVTVESLKIENYTKMLEIVGAIDALKSELLLTYEKLLTRLKCSEILEEDKINQAMECICLLNSIEICQKDVDKATETETEARSTKKKLLIFSLASALTVFGLIATGPLLVGALGPAQAAIDSCVKAKKLAENRLNKKLDELEVSELNLSITEAVKTKHLEQTEVLIDRIDDQKNILDQFRSHRDQLNTIDMELFSCLHLMKILTERHSLLIHECPLAPYSHRCIVFSVHLMYDIMKNIKLPINIEQLHLPPLPQVPSPLMLETSDDLICTDLSIPQQETMFDLLYTAPCAMYNLHLLYLNSAAADDNPRGNCPIFKGIQMLCNVFSDLHSSMDFLHCLITNMQIMLAEAGHQILTEMDNEEDVVSVEGFKTFETCINCLQVASVVAAQKIAFNENQMHASLEYWSRLFQQLLQAEYDSKESLDQFKIDQENLLIQNDVSQIKQMEMLEQKQKIEQTISENENKFHSAISEVGCDGKLLALDISIELSFDILFCFLPFMKAVQFADEAWAIGRFLFRKIETLGPAVKRSILSFFRKKKNGDEPEDSPQDKHCIYIHCDKLKDYVDDFRAFINNDGRLELTFCHLRTCELKWKLNSFLDFVHDSLPECQALSTLMGICLCGLTICESLEILERKKFDGTTPEADQIADEIQNFSTMADDFIAEAEAFETKTVSTPPIRSVPWYETFLNGFTGYKAKHKLFLTQTVSERLQNEEKRLKPIKRDLQKEIKGMRYRKFKDTILQIREANEQSRMNWILDTQEHVANMTKVWNKIYTDFSTMEVLFKCANEKMSSLNVKSSSSMWERFMVYQQALEGVTMFHDLSKFIKAYLAISENHFMPMLTMLIQSVDCEGKDSEWINNHRIAFEDKINFFRDIFAIECSKLN